MNGNSNWVDAPPKQGMGCFGKGCLIVVAFFVFLGIACIAGIFWGLKSHSGMIQGIFWLTKIRAVSQSPAPVPAFHASESEIDEARSRWQRFEEMSREGQQAMIELTARDLNLLIAANPDASGRVFASIDGNRLRFQTSVPLSGMLSRNSYFNADIVVESDGPQSFDRIQLNRVEVNGKSLPDDLLEWKFRSRRFRDYLSDYVDVYRNGSFEIRDGKLILRTGNMAEPSPGTQQETSVRGQTPSRSVD